MTGAIDWLEQVVKDEKIKCSFTRLPGYLFPATSGLVSYQCSLTRLPGYLFPATIGLMS